MKAFHLNVDQSQEEVTEALQEHQQTAQFVCVETKQHIVPRDHLLSVFDGLSNFTSTTGGNGTGGGIKQCFIKRIQSLPAQSLVQLLSRQQQMDFLYLQNVTINADTNSIRRLAETFRSHRGLRKVRFWQVKPGIGTNISLEGCFSALSTIPTLEEFTFIHSSISSSSSSSPQQNDNQQQQQQDMGRSSLQDLCSSKSLKVLTLTFPNTTTRTWLKDEHIPFMCQSLRSNNVLKSLSIRGNLGKLAGDSIATLVRKNTKLEQLRIQLQSVQHAMPIIDSLHHNTNLKRLGLVLPRKEDNNIDNDDNRNNPTTTIQPTSLRNQFTSKVIEMLRDSNYYLQHLDVGGSGFWTSYDDQNMIRFYLKTNQIGRSELLSGGATKSQWEDTLTNNCGDFSILYYFLLHNPSLALSILDKLITIGSTTTFTGTSSPSSDGEIPTATTAEENRKRSRDGAAFSPKEKDSNDEKLAGAPPPPSADHKKFKAS